MSTVAKDPRNGGNRTAREIVRTRSMNDVWDAVAETADPFAPASGRVDINGDGTGWMIVQIGGDTYRIEVDRISRRLDMDDPADQQEVREHFEGLAGRGFSVRVEE